LLALGAADDERLALAMGRAAALEGRAAGIHWTFAPVADVNVNPDNPIAATRSLGDRPERVARLVCAIVRGMQENGLAACVKHFPGDGVDDFDQHTVTTVNSLPLEKWKAVSARPFAAAFAQGVWSLMAGHIALPAWDPETDARGALRPATVNRRIITDLLRRELGFQGLVVTDDMSMGGVSGYLNRRERTVQCITAGCDMLLFPRLPEDFYLLVSAADSGELPAERVDEAARRVLEFKARLNLHRGEFEGPGPTPDQRREFEAASRTIAERALVRVRDVNGRLPVRGLKPGARVATVTLTADSGELTEVDAALRARGFAVEHFLNPAYGFHDIAPQFDAVFVNFHFKACWGVNTVRSVGVHNRLFMHGFHLDHPCAVFTSFGSPYHLRQFSGLPNYINAHSSSAHSQRAAVSAWFGDLPFTGQSPVGQLVREF